METRVCVGGVTYSGGTQQLNENEQALRSPTGPHRSQGLRAWHLRDETDWIGAHHGPAGRYRLRHPSGRPETPLGVAEPPSTLTRSPLMASRHRGCIICGQFHQYRKSENARKMRAVYSACLTVSAPFSRQALAEKQEPPEVGASEGSTAPNRLRLDGRAASAQSDTTGRQ
jgi:hypothetical protein